MAARTWTGLGADDNWSTAPNWDGGVAVPATTDSITYDNALPTSSKNCTIDALGTWSGGTFTITAAYTGVITQNVNMTTAAFLHNGTGAGTNYSQNANLTTTTYTIGTGASTKGHVVVSGSFQCSTTVIGTSKLDLSGASPCLTTGTITCTNGTTSVITAPSGTWETRSNWTKGTATVTFNANGGTINFTGGGGATMNVPTFTFNLCTLNQSAGGLTITTGTTIPFGASPTLTSTGANITINGTATMSGAVTMNGDFNVGSTGIVTGSITSMTIASGDYNLNATATFPASVPFTLTGTSADAITSTVIVLGLATFNKTGGITIAASTSVTLASVSHTRTAVTVNGTLVVPSGVTLNCSTYVAGASSTTTGPGTISCNSTFTMNATGTVTGGASIINVSMDSTGGSARVFGGGGKTYGTLVLNGQGASGITITGTNTFGTISAAPVISAYTVTFPNVTTTVGQFLVDGALGKVITFVRTGGAGTFTLTSTAGGPIVCNYISVSNSTVDVAPLWYAGTGSTIGAGCTNWLTGVNPKARKTLAMIG